MGSETKLKVGDRWQMTPPIDGQGDGKFTIVAITRDELYSVAVLFDNGMEDAFGPRLENIAARLPAPSVDPGVQPGVGRCPPQAGDVWAWESKISGHHEYTFTGTTRRTPQGTAYECNEGEHHAVWYEDSIIGGKLTFVRHGTPQEQRAEPPRPAPVKMTCPRCRTLYVEGERHGCAFVGPALVPLLKESGKGIAKLKLPPPHEPYICAVDDLDLLPDA